MTARCGTTDSRAICSRRLQVACNLTSLSDVVDDYVQKFKAGAESDINYYASQPFPEAAINQAGLARRPDGKRQPHQRRIPRSALKEATRRLRDADFCHIGAFHDLLLLVEGIVLPIRGIGELYVYDTALRIGASLGYLPQDVYLHAGARAGARALGLPYHAEWLSRTKLPSELRCLEAYQVEYLLCIYKQFLHPFRLPRDLDSA